MILWFLTLAALGVPHIVRQSGRPRGVQSAARRRRFSPIIGWRAFFTLGAVFLSVTGAEALYADMGHFGRTPIRIAWFALVLPALVPQLPRSGRAAAVGPDGARATRSTTWRRTGGCIPLVVLATCATVIASQAVISGAFSLTQQAMQLGYSPRFGLQHTSARERGQVYMPEVNWLLMFATIGLVLGFGSSTKLAAAYGMAVTTTMVITTILLYVVARERWGWGLLARGPGERRVSRHRSRVPRRQRDQDSDTAAGFRCSLAIGIYTVMTTWYTGRRIVTKRLAETEVPLSVFFESVAHHPPARVPGTGIFMTARPKARRRFSCII